MRKSVALAAAGPSWRGNGTTCRVQRPGLAASVTLLASIACGGAWPALAQGPWPSAALAPYLQLVARYQHGEWEPAAREMSFWPEARLKEAVSALRAQPIRVVSAAGPAGVQLATIEAAIALHTNAAFSARQRAPAEGTRDAIHRQIQAALSLITHIDEASLASPVLRGAPRLVPTREWLLGAAAVLHVGSWDLGGAGDLYRRALSRYPDDPQVLMAVGMYQENLYRLQALTLAFSHSGRRGSTTPSGVSIGRWRDRALVQQLLSEAADHLERAVEGDGTLDEARVRLAHVQMQLGRPDRAAPLLAKARTGSQDPAVLYLAELFTARIAEQRDAFDEAVSAYRRAIAQVTTAQAARIGLAHLLERAGHPDDARAAAAQALLAPPNRDLEEDPWWLYTNGYSPRGLRLLEEMRARVAPQ